MSVDHPLRVALVGTPSHPEVEWNDASLTRLRALGFNAVQLNIAWSYRPDDEVLNLEDVIAIPGAPEPLAGQGRRGNGERRARLTARARLARRHGFRTILHVGIPFQGRAGFDGAPLPQCISDPGVTDRYEKALSLLAQAIPEIDDILVYTYDQDAWLCSEFGGCDRCLGVPLHERLPRFLNGLGEAWNRSRPNGRVWWEPWELSSGQALACVPRLDPSRLGVMVHNTIGEVISTRPADAFVRNLATAAASRGLPVVVEIFLSSSNEEVEPWTHLPVPLVTIEQLRAVDRVVGVSGVKEYFGLRLDEFDVNLNAAAAYFRAPNRTDGELLDDVAALFGEKWLPRFWTLASEAYSLYPWDASWFGRQLGRSQPVHETTAATVRGAQTSASAWDTPAWRSSRHAVFMRTDNGEPHPWLLEDVGLRCSQAADRMTDALAVFDREPWVDRAEHLETHLQLQRLQALGFVTRTRAYAFHIRETLLACVLRSEPRPFLRDELRRTLEADLANQEREVLRLAEVEALGAPEISEVAGLQATEKWVVQTRTDLDGIKDALSTLTRSLPEYLATYSLAVPGVARAGQFSLTSR
ncbi:hypothetical protein [Herbiconiux sp. A18JL235]|uniref:Beta-hexosaminidase bacterial type N-terminal domain-containing protein n=1 Tax=Herbiconiux sp. A18JL235 TaxID=3152363 RepID=A0AB39BFL5_9MICO